jgi:hypothetical protein
MQQLDFYIGSFLITSDIALLILAVTFLAF